MANYVITSGSNSFTFEVDGRKSEYSSNALIPSTPDGSGNIIRIKDTTRNLTTVAFIENEALKIDLSVDTVNVNGTTVWADADALLNALKAVFFFSLGGTGGWNGEVDTRNDLPLTSPPLIGQIYLVRNPITDTVLGIPYRTYQSGLYIKDADTGSLSDWRRLNVKVQFTDSEFTLNNASNTSKQAKFNLANISSGFSRLLALPDRDGTLALLENHVADWAFIGDNTYTSASPQLIPNGVKTKLDINADFTLESRAGNAAAWWDDLLNRIVPTATAEIWDVRLNASYRPAQGDRILDITGESNTLNVFSKRYRLPKTAGSTARDFQNVFFAVGNTIINNGVEIYILNDTDVEIFDISLLIERKISLNTPL